MARYIVRRLLYMIPMIFCVVLAVFLIMSLTPGDPAGNTLPISTPQSVKDAYNEAVGYTGSLPSRFLAYCDGLIHGRVLSYATQENIFTELAVRMPLTLRYGMVGFLLAGFIGVSLGILSAVKQYSFLDTAVTVTAVAFASIPSFFFAICLILYFSVYRGVLPSFGSNDGIRSYILPTVTLVLSSVPVLSRMTRSAMLDTLQQDYIRTARAKGCSEKRVIWKHALKNASLPIIALLVSGFAGILGGSVIVESIFTLPGIGTYMINGINAKNVPVVMTCALLLSFVFMLSMVLMDIFFALIDPKIRLRYKR